MVVIVVTVVLVPVLWCSPDAVLNFPFVDSCPHITVLLVTDSVLLNLVQYEYLLYEYQVKPYLRILDLNSFIIL